MTSAAPAEFADPAASTVGPGAARGWTAEVQALACPSQRRRAGPRHRGASRGSRPSHAARSRSACTALLALVLRSQAAVPVPAVTAADPAEFADPAASTVGAGTARGWTAEVLAQALAVGAAAPAASAARDAAASARPAAPAAAYAPAVPAAPPSRVAAVESGSQLKRAGRQPPPPPSLGPGPPRRCRPACRRSCRLCRNPVRPREPRPTRPAGRRRATSPRYGPVPIRRHCWCSKRGPRQQLAAVRCCTAGPCLRSGLCRRRCPFAQCPVPAVAAPPPP